MKRTLVPFAVFAAFVWTVWLANWALKRWGTVPVGFGLEAPAGVYFAGLGFLLRDVLYEVAGAVWVIGGIITGALVSYLIDANVTIPGGVVSIAIASGLAFLFSELCDMFVYTPLRTTSWPAAVGFSQVVGAFVDSVVFLALAFGSMALLWGQVVGKTLFVAPIVLAMFLFRRTRVAPA